MLSSIIIRLSKGPIVDMDTFSVSGSSLGSQSHLLAALSEVVILLPVFLLLFTWRGFFQALLAKLMGDSTAEEDGFLTLNPIAHVDLVGLLTILGVFFIMVGFFSGAIPRTVLLMMLIIMGVRWTHPVHIDETRFKNYRLGGIITSLAGPFANFFLAFISVGILKLILQLNIAPYAIMSFIEIFKTLISIAIFFGVIDLIPIPPFDGGKMLRFVLPYRMQHILQWLEEYSFFIVLVLFFAPGVSDIFFGSLHAVSTVIKHFFFTIFF